LLCCCGIGPSIDHYPRPAQRGRRNAGDSPIDQTLSIPIHNGRGTYVMPKKTTLRMTITGTGTICAPAKGTWNLTVVDLVARKVVFEGHGISANQPVRFSYKTSFSTQLEAFADWSENADTTLQLRIVAGM
jgi:hypothetical protein